MQAETWSGWPHVSSVSGPSTSPAAPPRALHSPVAALRYTRVGTLRRRDAESVRGLVDGGPCALLTKAWVKACTATPGGSRSADEGGARR